MDNVITPAVPPSLNLPPTDKAPVGEIVLSPGTNIMLRPQESILLTILNESSASASVLSSDLPATLKAVSAGKEIDVPVRLKLETPLNLPTDKPAQIVVRSAAVENGRLNVRVVSVNGETPAKYTLPLSSPVKSGLSVSAPDSILIRPQQNPVAAEVSVEKPLIVETGTSVRQAGFHPVELAPLVEKIAADTKLPQNIIKEVAAEFKNVTVRFSLEQVVDRSLVGKNGVAPNPDYRELPRLNLPLEQVTERVQLVMNTFAADAEAVTLPETRIREMGALIKNEFRSLSGIPIAGDAVTLQENQVIAVKTPLGNVLLDSPLKVSEDSRFLLNIKDISFPDAEKSLLPELVSSRQLNEELMGLRPLLALISASPKNAASLQNILNLVAPLKNAGAKGTELSAEIIGKIPGLNDKMLPNMVNFVKGAMKRNVTEWIGKELTEELNRSGAEGREVISRLNGFINANSREGVSWRMVEIPFLDGGSLSKIRVAVKKYDDDEKEKNAEGKSRFGTRFVVDTSFSRLGAFQFDGFSVAKERRFDLIIRTSRSVGNDLCANIMRIFKTTLNEVGYAGSINVNVKENFIKICEDERSETLKDGIYI